MKRFYAIAALLFFAAFLGWKLEVGHSLTERIPRDWSFEAEYLGNLVYADEKGQVQAQKNLSLYQRYWSVRQWQDDRAVIEDIYQIIDVQSGEVMWKTTLMFHVDAHKGTIIRHEKHPEAKGLFYIFPQNVQQKNYEFFNYDLHPYTMRYQRKETREGLELYVFSFQGTIDYTELTKLAYLGSEASPFGEDTLMISDDFYREIWVEPVTGSIIHIIEDDPGDYIVDNISGENKRLYAVWSGKTTGNTVKYLLQRAKKNLWQLRLYRWWIPGLFLVGTLFFLVLALCSHFDLKQRSV